MVLQTEKIHGGSRILFRCGKEAQEYTTQILAESKKVSAMLSAKPTEISDAVARMSQELSNLKLRESVVQKEWYRTLAELYRGKGNVLLFPTCGDTSKMALAVAETCGGTCGVFLSKEEGYSYAVAEKNGNLQTLSKTLHGVLGGKGGGRGELVQGYITASKKDIQEFWEKNI